MRLGIVAALSREVQNLTTRALCAGAVVRLSDRSLLAVSGIGPERARAAGRVLLDQGAAALASWGSAAALDARLAPGSLSLPRTVIGADHSISCVTPDWHERLQRCLNDRFGPVTGPLAEARSVLLGPADKRALAQDSGAVAADMESAALGQLAAEARVPFIVVRAISDTALMTVPGWIASALDEQGRPRPLRLCAALLRHPQDIPALVRLARGFRLAQETLAAVMARAGDDLLVAT
jgi:adenosylhomocysteine nucleosidase